MRLLGDRHSWPSATAYRHLGMAALAACAALALLASVTLVDADSNRSRLSGHGPPVGSTAHAAVAAVQARTLAREPPGTLAVAVRELATDATATNVAGDTAMYSASLSKLIVAVDILHRSRGALDPRTESLIRRSLAESDDAAMNVLWSTFDGHGAIERVAKRLGMPDTHAPDERGQWGEVVLTANDLSTLLDHVATAMPAPDRSLMVTSMRSAPEFAADGFDQSFGVDASRTDEPVAAKKGWMCCPSGRASLHSAALVGDPPRYVVVVLYRQPAENGYGNARQVVNRVAATLLDELSSRANKLPVAW